jgi:hypothetical protein
MNTVDARTNRLVALLEEIRRTPLDAVSVQQAADVNRDVHDRTSNELPVSVARFGSAI